MVVTRLEQSSFRSRYIILCILNTNNSRFIQYTVDEAFQAPGATKLTWKNNS